MGIVLAVASAMVAVTAARRPPAIGLREFNSAREALTPIVRSRGRPPLTPLQVTDQLGARGFRDITPPKRRGRIVIVSVTARRTARIAVVIDLSTGQITGARL
jgi:hypothetical protein